MGAPSFELFGAFFPAWMLCALFGVVGAATTRLVLAALPFQLAVCTAIGVTVGVLLWTILCG